MTTDNLCKRGFHLPNICIFRMADVESVPHLFIKCPFAQEILGRMLQLWDLCWVFPSTMTDLFIQWRAPSNNQVIKRLWSYSLLHLVWGIWKERNNRIFKDTTLSVEIVFHKIKRAVNEKFNCLNCVQLRKGTQICTNYDYNIANAWKIQMDISRVFD